MSDRKDEIEKIFGIQKVDLMIRDGIHPALKDIILGEAVDVIQTLEIIY